jgi:ethanolamine ammonia-lyase small subunit
MNVIPSSIDMLKDWTHARISLGRAGGSLPTEEYLKLKMAHALAQDAVNLELDLDLLEQNFKSINQDLVSIQSEVSSKHEFLLNPPLGKKVNQNDLVRLNSNTKVDLCVIMADGLSANAIHLYASDLFFNIKRLLEDWSFSPVILVKYGRVAISDHIGSLQNAEIALILIGERPGLSSPESLGAYLTYGPELNNTDEKRNCVSNIHKDGLSISEAAQQIVSLLLQMKQKRFSGVQLKPNLGIQFDPHKILER